jgi:hypothetical protein
MDGGLLTYGAAGYPTEAAQFTTGLALTGQPVEGR